jgi:DNA replication protein DnaC
MRINKIDIIQYIMVCCLCNEGLWLSVIDSVYYFDVALIENFHYHLLKGIGSELTDMIDLVRLYRLTVEHITAVIKTAHGNCKPCAACGHVVASDSLQHESILQAAVDYYIGLNDQQSEIMSKLDNCYEEMIEINEMIGMTSIKKEFVSLIKFLATINPEELQKNSFLMHMVISGPPGHGKTEIAKLLGNAFRKSGILTSDKFVIATRANLIGKYCGHTAKETTAMFDRARGGVIFIDEVYSLGNPEKRDVFTGECINTINQLLSERTDTLCIIAGYEKEIAESFFSYNPGLERRFPWRFKIKQYSEVDLVNIFKKKVAAVGYELEPDALLESDIKAHKDMFPNAGGDIVNLVTNCMLAYYDNSFLYPKLGRPINRCDVLSGLNRYIGNREVKVPDMPPMHMYS